MGEEMKNNSNVEWKTIRDICEVKYGDRITKKEIEPGNYYFYGGGDKSYMVNKFNREGLTCKVSRFGASEKNCVLILNEKYWLNDSGFTTNSNDTKILLDKYYFYYIYNYLNNNHRLFKKLYHG